jgi:hypothetical protein
MQHQLALATGALGVAVVLGTLVLLPRSDPPAIPPASKGHLVLLIEGDAHGLRITHITAKRDPYNPVYGARPPHDIVLYDQNARELGRYPLDLSRFDLDPANAGKPPRVQGCEVIDTKVVLLANIPWLPNASFLEIEKGTTSVGELAASDYARLVSMAEQTLDKQR